MFNKLKKKELTDDERTEMKEKFADVSISSVLKSIRLTNTRKKRAALKKAEKTVLKLYCQLSMGVFGECGDMSFAAPFNNSRNSGWSQCLW